MALEVVCSTVDESSTHSDCRCISEIGYEATSMVITKSPEEMHDEIEDGREFYVEHFGSKAYLIPAERNGTKYVRTEPNDTEKDNLLQLDSC